MPLGNWLLLASMMAPLPLCAQSAKPFDAAAAFGARESVADVSLSPDGTTVAYVVPTEGQGSTAYTLSLSKGAVPRGIVSATGKPERLESCHWVSNERLACMVYIVITRDSELLPITRVIAVNADGSNPQMLSNKSNAYTRGYLLGGGRVIDWLPDEDGAALMSRVYLPDDHVGTRLGSSKKGLGVDWVDTRTLAIKMVEPPREDAAEYITDGRGAVRIMGIRATQGSIENYDSGVVSYYYRQAGSREWQKLGDENRIDGTGFDPYAVDHERDVVYGFKKKDGRRALYSIALDGSLREDLIFARPDVDLGGLTRIGRRGRVVGVTFTTDMPQSAFFDPAIEKLAASLSKALPAQPIVHFVDSNLDESKLLVLARGDQDPGAYYLFDRKSRQLDTFFVVRKEIEGVKLAAVKPISYRAADGTVVPGYLTLPPGQESAKGLPAIVLPHGGPSERDVWGFDWMAQFYAARGFAVLQPNFRGSWGYGDEWFRHNGFQSWRTAIGDVLDAGRWLVAQGIADPNKLGIVGWSYGGYAALQSAIVDPGLFKAVVAIAPVTDLRLLKEEHRNWSDFKLISAFIGDGPQVSDGSPAQHADKIKVPVLLFHGALDRNVGIRQSREMSDRLASAGVRHELVTWEYLDHQLQDSTARADMLRKSDAFLRQAMGM
jgi:dienelactone hydrolase